MFENWNRRYRRRHFLGIIKPRACPFSTFRKTQKICIVKFQINYLYITCPCFHLIMNEIPKPKTKKHIRRLSVLEAGFRLSDYCKHDACHIKKLCTQAFFSQSIERPAGVREFISWNRAEESLVSHYNCNMKRITSTSFTSFSSLACYSLII